MTRVRKTAVNVCLGGLRQAKLPGIAGSMCTPESAGLTSAPSQAGLLRCCFSCVQQNTLPSLCEGRASTPCTWSCSASCLQDSCSRDSSTESPAAARGASSALSTTRCQIRHWPVPTCGHFTVLSSPHQFPDNKMRTVTHLCLAKEGPLAL